MDKIKSKKIALVAFTGALAVSTMAVAFTFKEPTVPIKSTNQRVVVVDKSNVVLGAYGDGSQENFTNVLFPLKGGSYHRMYVSQSQESVYGSETDTCILALWGGSEVQLFVNYEMNSKTYSLDPEGKQVCNLVYFSHLTQIDLTLDNSDDHRITTLQSTVGGVTAGKFEVIEQPDKTKVRYKWTPDNALGYVPSNQRVKFYQTGWEFSGKAVWLLDMTFYYDC